LQEIGKATNTGSIPAPTAQAFQRVFLHRLRGAISSDKTKSVSQNNDSALKDALQEALRVNETTVKELEKVTALAKKALGEKCAS